MSWPMVKPLDCSAVSPVPFLWVRRSQRQQLPLINVCAAVVEYSANLEFRTVPPPGVICQPSLPPPPVPPQPVPIPAPIAPLPTFTFVDCTVVPEIQCVLLDGRSCDAVVSRTNDCAETFRYILSVRNAGTAALDVTAANIITDGSSTSFLASLGPNPIPVGGISTAAQDVVVDICGTFQFSVSVNVAVDPTDEGNACRSAIPMPTVITIGGPVAAPVAVPSPIMTATTLVDCNLVSTLESCTLEDGSLCSSLQVSPDQCDVDLFFNVRLENAGSIELTVTRRQFRVWIPNDCVRIQRSVVERGASVHGGHSGGRQCVPRCEYFRVH